MGKIDSRPLKAFVRFDGSGRIVAGSLILRRKKPKVGKWVEIPAYECCNPTTTTTTTVSPTPQCLKYLFTIPDGGLGNLQGVDCEGAPIAISNIPGPITDADLCARTLTGTGDITVVVVNNCDTPCITYQITVLDGNTGVLNGIDCNGSPFNLSIPGPISAPYCFRTISSAFDATVSVTGPCDTTTTTTTLP
jgi:hypothetical protein